MKKLFFLLACCLGLAQPAWAATSYANPYGSGDRLTHLFVIGDTTSGSGGADYNLVDGVTNDNDLFLNNGSTTGHIKFWFPFRVVLDEAKWYQSGTTSHGTWKWQGSNDDSTWTDIGSTFTLGGATTQTQTSLNGNNTGYSFYRLTQTAGAASDAVFIHEVEFKIGVPTGPSFVNALGSGDRTGTITITEANIVWNGGKSNLVDGTFNNEAFWNSATNVGASFTFDFGADYILRAARWYMDQTNDQGVWKWQGSNDNSSYTDLSADFNLGTPRFTVVGPKLVFEMGDLSANTTAYRYYRMTGVSGSHNGSPWLWEIDFMIASVTGSAGAGSDGGIDSTFNAIWAGISGFLFH